MFLNYRETVLPGISFLQKYVPKVDNIFFYIKNERSILPYFYVGNGKHPYNLCCIKECMNGWMENRNEKER